MKAARRLTVVPPDPVGTDLAQQWANEINASLGATVQSVIATGQKLLAAKKNMLVKRGWLRMFKDHREPVANPLRIGRSSAHKLMAIAAHPIVGNVEHVLHLPPEWGHLYALTTLPVATLKVALAEGRIHPDMTRRQISAMKSRTKKPPRPKKPVVSLATLPRIDRAQLLTELPAAVAQQLEATERVVLLLNHAAYRPAIAKYLRDLADSVRPFKLEQQENVQP